MRIDVLLRAMFIWTLAPAYAHMRSVVTSSGPINWQISPVHPRAALAADELLHAVLMECGTDEILYPGDVQWLHVVDEDRAAMLNMCRSPPYNSLLAQSFSKALSTRDKGSVVPVLQYQITRKTAAAGSLVEVICIGRGMVEDSGARGTACFQEHVDMEDGDESDEQSTSAMSELARAHAACCDLAGRLRTILDASSPRDGVTWLTETDVCDVKQFGETLEELVAERRLALRRRALCNAEHRDSEILSYVACRWLKPADRLRALETTRTSERLALCVDGLHERRARMAARLSLHEALASA